MVQKGKFAAADADSPTKALKSVDLPTLGRPTIPAISPMRVFERWGPAAAAAAAAAAATPARKRPGHTEFSS